MKSLRVLFATPELRGLVSIGGLAEVAASLASALRQQGHDVRIVMPFYQYIKQHVDTNRMEEVWSGDLGLGNLPPARIYRFIFRHQRQQIPLYLVQGHSWFEQADSLDAIYAPEEQLEPYMFFAAAVLRFFDDPSIPWKPEVIHSHDYHTGLIPVYLKTRFQGMLAGEKVGTVFTIHNLGFQGQADRRLLSYGGLPGSLGDYAPNLSTMEYFGRLNALKGGIGFSEVTTTVSATYAREIQIPEHGKGLDGVLRELARQQRLFGIVNGINHDDWSPRHLPGDLSYDHTVPERKIRAKYMLRELTGLEHGKDPVIAIRARWGYQKGWDLVVAALRETDLLEWGQFVILTRGYNRAAKRYRQLWAELRAIADGSPHRVALITNGEPASIIHYAGSDMLLMPSLYEPCGLTQQEAMRYGCLPVVRKTGGLADTVDAKVGFPFEWAFREPLNPEQIREGVERIRATLQAAGNTYRQPEEWSDRLRNAMQQQTDWIHRVPEYEQIYARTLRRIGVDVNWMRDFAGLPTRRIAPVIAAGKVYSDLHMPEPRRDVIWDNR